MVKVKKWEREWLVRENEEKMSRNEEWKQHAKQLEEPGNLDCFYCSSTSPPQEQRERQSGAAGEDREIEAEEETLETVTNKQPEKMKAVHNA